MSIAMPFDRLARASLLQEARCEFLRLLRTPSFALPTILFPMMFYLLFGVFMGGKGVPQASAYLLASYTIFGVMSPGLFGFGVVVALERERGLLALKRAQPMPPANYLFAKLAMAVLFAGIVFLLLATLGVALGGVRATAPQWIALAAVALLGVLPFCALGLLIGTRVGGAGAPAVVNLVYLPMAFLSGLAIPVFMLPPFLQAVAPLLPAYHLSQLAYAAIGQRNDGAALLHFVYLAGLTVVCFVLARRRLARVG